MKGIRSYIFTLVFLMTCATTRADVYEDTKAFGRTLMAIESLYVDTVDTGYLTETAIKALLKELDPHTTYLNADEVQAMQENLGGNFEGIGVRYQMENDTLLVINTVQGGPSEKVGILAGDRIIMVGDSTIAGMKYSTREIQRRLRGPKGSHVNVGIMRQGEKELLWFNVERDKIPVYSIDASYMATPQVGYIKVSRFAQTTAQEVEKAMKQLTAQGMKDVIIDLQGNGGGFLNAAVEMAELFLPAGQVVVYTEGRIEARREYKTRSSHNVFSGRVVVIMDEQSASAAEIFAGCIQDLDRGLVVGRRSFGKGLVQRPIDLPNGGMIRLTIAHYFTPSGRCIQKPYTKGDKKSYDEDILHRLNSGEMISADSIHFSDSLRYKTAGGRNVYGGGGIMPDLFVPLDTTQMTRAHRAVIAKGSLNRFIISHFKTNQAKLKKQYPTLDAFMAGNYEVNDEMINALIVQARADSVQSDSLETLLTNDLFRLQVKAYLANDLYENGAYSRVMNQMIPSYKESLDLICDDKRYLTLLSRMSRK